MIVSANPDTSELYVLSLRNERAPVVSASSASEAMPLLRQRTVSAVVVDVATPATDWHACREVKAAAEPDLPLVVLTGWIDEHARAEAFNIGCAAFVGKPASPRRLREVLQRTRAGERGIVSVD